MLVRFGDSTDDKSLAFVVICALYEGHWVYCRHHERTTYELPGGHREPGEEILFSARRELYEETGATDFDIRPISTYSVTGPTRANPNGSTTYGMLFFAQIYTLGPLPQSEMAEVFLSKEPLSDPGLMTYPLIQPLLLEETLRRIS